MKTKVPENLQTLIKTIYDDCVKEDTAVRERQIRSWRRFKLLWEGFQKVWFSEVAHDWRIWEQSQDQDTDQAYYDKPINLFKAYLESIIAALSVTIPPIKCYPDDADDTLDQSTAKAGDKISELVYRHNKAPLLWLHALFIYCTEGMVACYSYPKEDEAYGTYTENSYEDKDEVHQVSTCPNCGAEIDDQTLPMMNEVKENLENEFMPDDTDVNAQNMVQNNEQLCPQCMSMVVPEIQNKSFIVTKLVGETKHAKSRMCLEVYGGLYVKIPNYAHCQKEVPYLIFSKEIDYSLAVEEFEDLRGNKELIDSAKSSAGSYNQYAQWGRLSPQYQGEYPTNIVTINKIWIRPAKYNILKSEEDANLLRKKFPNGIKACFVNDCFGDACNESLDDCWTLLENPLSDYIHFNPLGESLVSVQDITNDLISLTLQTIEHGIGQTLVDPAILDFKAYEQTEALPGSIMPTKILGNKRIADGVFEFRTATLSSEVMPFSSNIQSYGQLASGALPSLFGGNLSTSSSNTASEYSMSRAQALQRLQNTWKMLTEWWKDIFGKVIPMYIKEMKDDEKDVQRDSHGGFINVFIRKAELEGKIGKIELDANENLPITWGQKKDLIEKLLMNPNPLIEQILTAPENLSIIHEALGLTDLFIPGEDYVMKQYDEIKEMLNSQPSPDIELGTEMPSVEVDEKIDNHPIEFEICRKWLISDAGRQAKNDNPDGYRNVLLHAYVHFQFMQMQMAMQMQQQQQGNGKDQKKPDSTKTNEAPIRSEGNVQVTH